jgi:type IV pilus assembly protein PilB
LSSTSLFRDAEPTVAQKVAPHFQVLEFGSGEPIIRAGVKSESMGVLFSGRLTIRLIDAATGEATIQEELRVGDHFGEIAPLLGSAQPYEVMAEDDSTVLLVGNDVVKQLASRIPAFTTALARRLAARLVKAGVNALRPGSGKVVAATPAPAADPAPAAPPAAPGTADQDVIPFVAVSAYDITDQLARLVPVRLVRQHRFLPLRLQEQTLTVGMVDPHNAAGVAEIRRLLHSVDLRIVAISQDDFSATLNRLKLDSPVAGPKNPHELTVPDAITYDKEDQERDADKAIRVIGDEVVHLVNKIVAAGIDRGASDIHIEEEQAGVRVRLRVSGMLHDWDKLVPSSFAKGLVARLKVLAGMDIAERRLPQDGRIGCKVDRREIDLRVSTMPTSRGEKVVLRLFEAASMMRPLEQIFLEQNTLGSVREALGRPFGAIVVAGPTGSGKSSTLYACLHECKKTRADSSLCLVEDPVEYRLQGVTQVQVNHAAKLGFAQVLRGFMRQDPDVIMVGEVRDAETAQLALEAAMTGHLLLTSFHASNAMAVIPRLDNLECNRTMIAQSLALIVVQRLARRLCPRCLTTEPPPPVLLASLAERGLVDRAAAVPLPRATGCAECSHSGFAGRVAVIESLRLGEDLRTALMADKPLHEIEEMALEAGLLIPFRRYASFLMTRKLIGPAEALLTVAG